MPPRPECRPGPRPGRARALIFDMDGVLVDSEPLWRRAEIEIFGQVGLSLSEKDCLQTQGMRIDEVVAWWFDRAPWPDRPPADVARAIVERVAELIRREGTALPGAHLALEAALAGVRNRGWRLALASSSSKFLIATVLDHLGWSQVFECTHSAEDEAFGKPHPAVYLSTARTLGVPPGDCLAIEDSVHGVQSAIAAGMCCIAISPLGTSRDPRLETAHAILDSLARLPEALEKWEESEAQKDRGAAMTPIEMEACVRAYFTAVGAGDRPGLLALFTPDLRWRVPQGAIEPYAGLHEGAENVVEMMLGAVAGAFVPGSQETEIRNLVFGADLAVAETEMRAVTPAGERYRNDYTFFFEFREGRIAEIREHVDTRYAAEFFGGTGA